MQQERKQAHRSKVNLLVDILIFVAFLIAMAPHFSGMTIHEWLGIAFGAAIVTHLLLHWQWLVGITRRFFSPIKGAARLNYALNALLFVNITVIIFTGIMISKVALPSLGIQFEPDMAWRGLHTLSSELSVYLIGLHVALHWGWIVSAIKRLVVTPLLGGRRVPQLAVTTEQVQQEA